MSGSRPLIFAIVATTSIFAAGAMRASAEEIAAVGDEAVAKEVVVAANDGRDTVVPTPEILPITAPAMAKPKPGRAITPAAAKPASPPPARVAAGQQPHWGCFWCGRQFVLMLGVGY
jgi:hypothetical protein